MTRHAVPTGTDPAILAAWDKDTEEEIARLTSAIVPLQASLDAARERLDLIRRLARLASGNGHDETEKRQPIRAPFGDDVEGHIQQLLQSEGKPLHIGEIRQKLIDRGVPLPGRGDE